MNFENTQVWGFEHAIRGMRNPKNSWAKSDSTFNGIQANIGSADLKLMQTLIKSGSEHRKFLRQIFVSVDITAPMYWWSEFDTYKVSTVANSTSKMHKLASTPITFDCFEHDDFINTDCNSTFKDAQTAWQSLIEVLESLRNKFNETKTAQIRRTINAKLILKRHSNECLFFFLGYLSASIFSFVSVIFLPPSIPACSYRYQFL